MASITTGHEQHDTGLAAGTTDDGDLRTPSSRRPRANQPGACPCGSRRHAVRPRRGARGGRWASAR